MLHIEIVEPWIPPSESAKIRFVYIYIYTFTNWGIVFLTLIYSHTIHHKIEMNTGS